MGEKTVKLTYTGPSGQALVGVGPLTAGEEIEVSAEAAESLADHRWFEGGPKSKKKKEESDEPS